MSSLLYDVYALGNALVDQEYLVSDAFLEQQGISKGQMTLIDDTQLTTLTAALKKETSFKKRASGGSAANTVMAVAAFGGHSFYSCKVANDEIGDFYMNDLHAAGVHSNLAGEREAGTSGTCLVMVTPDAERTMNTFLGITANVSHQELVPTALKQSRWLYIEGYLVTSDSARAAVQEARAQARAHGVHIAMTFSDPAMVQFFQPGLREMMGNGVDLLFCNEQEAKLFADCQSIDQALQTLQTVASHVVVTLGAKGAVIMHHGQRINIAPSPATPVDSNGAGDMFAGAYLYGLTQGFSCEQAGLLASRAAAAVVSQFGPRLPLDQHKEILASLNVR